LGWVPGYGDDLQALPDLLGAGQSTNRAGLILLDSLGPLLTTTDFNLSHVITTLSQAEADLARAQAQLQTAQVKLQKIDLNELSAGLAKRPARLKQLLPLAITGLELARQTPALLGAESPQTYLILTQNADEIRPSGGYINAAGHVVLDRGRITELVMQDSYAVDRLSDEYPYPPQPIYRFMAADYWVLRDASWSPDFPTTARTALELYALGQGISAAGVIALDQHALPDLVRAFEPVEVDGQQVTSQNVIKLLRQHWAPYEERSFQEWWPQRKSFSVALVQAIRQEIEQNQTSLEFAGLARTLEQSLAQKHFLIYLEDPTWFEFLENQNWAGRLAPAKGDYLMAVDANLGFNKANAVVERNLKYQVSLQDDGSAQAQVSLLYHHLAQQQANDCSQEPRYDYVYEQNMARCYWNYQRLIVPAGAELVNGPSHTVAGQYLLQGQATSGEIAAAPVGTDKISWGQLFLLAPQESLSVDYRYRLPPDTVTFEGDQWEYSLFLQKQPGTLAPPVEISVTLPEGARILDSQPAPDAQQGSTLNYQINQETDLLIRLSYTLP
jgi:hypothetical protein